MHLVTMQLEEVEAIRDGESGSAEPYLWTVFFSVDANRYALDLTGYPDIVRLSGSINPRFGLGSQGNIGSKVSTGDIVAIPPTVGLYSSEVEEIIIPGRDPIPPIIACVMILMEENAVSADGAEAGHQALNRAIEAEINSFISMLNLVELDEAAAAAGISIFAEIELRFEQLKTRLSTTLVGTITDAIREQQGFFENIASFVDPDEPIGEPQVQILTLNEIPDMGLAFENTFRQIGGGLAGGSSLFDEAAPPHYIVRGNIRSRELVATRRNPVLIGSIEISCIRTITVDGLDIIAAVGGVSAEGAWIMDRSFAVQSVIRGDLSFFVGQGDDRVDVHVVIPGDGGEAFLRTDPDETTENNLLSLPICPIYVDEI